jgi:hypothetical protein
VNAITSCGTSAFPLAAARTRVWSRRQPDRGIGSDHGGRCLRIPAILHAVPRAPLAARAELRRPRVGSPPLSPAGPSDR